MSTDWKSLSPEKKAELNAKRRERYANLGSEHKAKIQSKALETYHSRSEDQKQARRLKEKQPILHNWRDTDTGTILPSSWDEKLTGIKRRMDARKSRLMKKLDRYTAWRKAGGLFPWPSLEDKMVATRLFLKIMHIKGRRCTHCGSKNFVDYNWRITRNDDFLAFVGFKTRDYERVLKNMDDYSVYCFKCAWDIAFFSFCWIFDPRSPRNSDKYPNKSIGGPKYRNWDKIWPVMYPPTHRALCDKIIRGEIKSLTCGIIMPDGRFKETFVRKNQYYNWVKFEPRQLSFHVTDQARHFYQKLRPEVQCCWWGDGAETGFRDLSIEKIGQDFVGDDLRRFLTEVPPGWQEMKTSSKNEEHDTTNNESEFKSSSTSGKPSSDSTIGALAPSSKPPSMAEVTLPELVYVLTGTTDGQL